VSPPPNDDWLQEGDLDDEGVDGDTPDDPDEEPTVACGACGRSVWEEAQRCPHCGEWIVAGGDGGRRSRWHWGVGLLALAGFVAWVLSPGFACQLGI
jgi:MYXO-CTERM domain-containing protein